MPIRMLVAGLVMACASVPVATASSGPMPRRFGDSVLVLRVSDGRTVPMAELAAQLNAAQLVLLGELHDDAVHHRVRAALLAGATSRPAIVFEHFAAADGPIAPPSAQMTFDSWLDANGFDRRGWRWPLHAPLVDAALVHGRAMWGSNVSSERLRPIIREGVSAAPAPWLTLLSAAPMDTLQTRLADEEIITGHCNQLPAAMVPGMRQAQLVRDAAMADAMLKAGQTGAVWLVAGNGHVRADLGVPRLLRVAAAQKVMLVVGFLEQEPDGAMPGPQARAPFDYVVVAPSIPRDDPCSAFR